MRKLEDIEKKQIFKVPDDYFDKLPQIIQSRTTVKTKNKSAINLYALWYAVPAVVFAMASILWFYQTKQTPIINIDSMLATVQTEDLVSYLDDSDLTTDEVLESVEFNNEDVDEIEISALEDLQVTKDDLLLE